MLIKLEHELFHGSKCIPLKLVFKFAVDYRDFTIEPCGLIDCRVLDGADPGIPEITPGWLLANHKAEMRLLEEAAHEEAIERVQDRLIPDEGSDICCSMCNGSHKVAVKKERLTCDVCNGSGMISASPMTGVYMERGCQKCDGTGKIIKPEKPKCKRCDGKKQIPQRFIQPTNTAGTMVYEICPSCGGTGTQGWEWPPVVWQEVYRIGGESNSPITSLEMIQDVCADGKYILARHSRYFMLYELYPTREMTEDYLKRRKELGI